MKWLRDYPGKELFCAVIVAAFSAMLIAHFVFGVGYE